MRLLSYNIHKGIGGRDRQYRLERIVEVIELENPDLICLQEVDRYTRRSRHDDQPQLLAQSFHAADKLFQLNVRLRSGGGYGNLVLSRWPFSSTHQVSLRLRRKKPRGAIVVIDTPEGPLQLVHWHLGLAERERHWQAVHLLGHHLFSESAGLPALIVGDTNDWRNTLGGGPMSQHGFHQATSPPSRFRSFPAYLALGSLDKAFYRGDVSVRHARVVHSRLTRRASDHLPLVLDFHLNGASP